MAKQAKNQSKSATVTKLLLRGTGATVAEIMKSTGWKEHSCRAFLAGVRKRSKLLKEQRPDGKAAYRIETAAEDDASVHNQGSRQHRYYVTRLTPGEDRKSAWRVPAGEIDRAVLSCIDGILSQRAVERLEGIETPFASDLSQLSMPEQRRILLENNVEVRLSRSAIQVRIAGDEQDEIQIPARLVKRGNELKLVLTVDQREPQNVDPVLLKLLVHASAAQQAALTGTADPLVSKYSKRHFWQLLRVSWLAPDIIAAIAEGRQPATLTGRRLLRVADVPLAWDEQRRLLGFN